MSGSNAEKKRGITPVVRAVASYATVRPRPNRSWGPVRFTRSRKALGKKAGWESQKILDLLEAKRSCFAAQACAVNKDMGLGILRALNVQRRAQFYPVPIGASGARISIRFFV